MDSLFLLMNMLWHYMGEHVLGSVVILGVVAVLTGWLIWALREHPTGFWFIFWGELAERASFYGMRTVLALYLISVLKFEQASGALIMSWFMALCYLLPLLGGVVADRVLGRYKTILYFSGPYILGHIILGGWETRTGLFISLALLAMGSGSIKPNTSTLMGAMYEAQKKDALLNRAFSYFYASINVGSFISTLVLPIVRGALYDRDTAAMNLPAIAGQPHNFDTASAAGQLVQAPLEHAYAVTLMIPALLMAAAFALFGLGKKHYPQEQVRDLPPKTAEQRTAERATLSRIIGLFLLIAVFWFVYDESASTWVYFAQDHMNLTVCDNWPLIGTFVTTPDQIQALNPFLIVFFTPIFNMLWSTLKNMRGGSDVPDTRKMLAGFFIVLVCMVTMAVAGFMAGSGKVSVWWMLIATIVITLSELCVSVVGLEFAFKVAAPGTKSFVTGVFWMMVFVGDFAQGFFNKALWGTVSPGIFFMIQSVIMLAALGAFVVIARKFERTTNVEQPLPATPQAHSA